MDVIREVSGMPRSDNEDNGSVGVACAPISTCDATPAPHYLARVTAMSIDVHLARTRCVGSQVTTDIQLPAVYRHTHYWSGCGYRGYGCGVRNSDLRYTCARPCAGCLANN